MAFELLIHSNTTDGSTVFTDSSPENHTLTPADNCQHSTAFAKWGASAIEMEVYPSSLATYNPVWGTNDWTIDFWGMRKSGQAAGLAFAHYDNGAGENPLWLNIATNYLQLSAYVGAASFYVNSAHTPAYLFPVDTWVHIGAVREGNFLKLYVGGVLEGTAAISGSINNPPDPADKLELGYRNYTPGLTYMDEFCVRMNEAIDFAATGVPTAPYLPTGIAGSVGLPLAGEITLSGGTKIVGSTVTGSISIPLSGNIGMASHIPVDLAGNIGVSLGGGFILGSNTISGYCGVELSGSIEIVSEIPANLSSSLDLSLDGYISLNSNKPVYLAGQVQSPLNGGIELESKNPFLVTGSVSLNMGGYITMRQHGQMELAGDLIVELNGVALPSDSQLGSCPVSLEYSRSCIC